MSPEQSREKGVRPDCWLGLSERRVNEVVGDRLGEFQKWMRGQTMAVCDGRRYDHETRQWKPTECADSPHGAVTYSWDVARFLRSVPSQAEWITAHVMPNGDLIDHTTDEDCPCGPTTVPVPNPDGSMGWNVIHHSLDGREALERLAEDGRTRASARDDLIAQGADPAELDIPASPYDWPSGVNGGLSSLLSSDGADDAPDKPKGTSTTPAPLGRLSCSCGCPEAFSLRPDEVITHNADGPCRIGPIQPFRPDSGDA